MASRQSKALVTQLALVAVVGAAALKDEKYAMLAAGLGQLGSGLLLANYSRADERQADQWGHHYLVKAGFHPAGMAHLMERLMALHDREPGVLEVMFSSHSTEYAAFQGQKAGRERYQDLTAGIRAQQETIVALQNGLEALGAQQTGEAERQFQTALRAQPGDYAGLLLMAKLKLAMRQYEAAQEFAERAKTVYPGEAQALHVAGLAALNRRQLDAALADFTAYETRLPGNPALAFYRGVTLDRMGRREAAAGEYQRFLQGGGSGAEAEAAVSRLTDWGYLKPPPPPPAPSAPAAPVDRPANAKAKAPKAKKQKPNAKKKKEHR
jgi:predicted Zn-dependent protease